MEFIMNYNTKQRGRPPGSSRHNDQDELYITHAIQLLEADATLKPTAAFRQVLPVRDTGGLRRLQDKFKQRGGLQLVLEARAEKIRQAEAARLDAKALDFARGILLLISKNGLQIYADALKQRPEAARP